MTQSLTDGEIMTAILHPAEGQDVSFCFLSRFSWPFTWVLFYTDNSP